MDTRPLYILPFRVIVGTVVGLLIVGLTAGAAGGWLAARRMLRVSPSGDRFVERVEQVTVTTEEALANAAAGVAPSVVSVLDGRGRIVASAVALTNDGVLVGAGAPPAGPVRVRRAGGEIADASVVRVYPEFGVYVLRGGGEYQAPAIERDAAAAPGTSLLAVALAADGSGFRARPVAVEADGLLSGDAARSLPALARVPTFVAPLPASYRGAAVVGVQGRLVGLVLSEGPTAQLLPGVVVDQLFRDALDHREETIVTVHGGIAGSWRTEPVRDGSQLVFRVTRSAGGAPASAEPVRAGDEIFAIRGTPLQGAAPLGLALLDAGRKREPLPVTVRRGTETVEASVLPTLR